VIYQCRRICLELLDFTLHQTTGLLPYGQVPTVPQVIRWGHMELKVGDIARLEVSEYGSWCALESAVEIPGELSNAVAGAEARPGHRP
jgi:hypothetical protein